MNRYVNPLLNLDNKEKRIMTQTMTIEYNPADSLVQPVIELIRQVKKIRIVSSSETFVPNAKTKAAMREARSANLKTYSDVKEMMTDILD